MDSHLRPRISPSPLVYTSVISLLFIYLLAIWNILSQESTFSLCSRHRSGCTGVVFKDGAEPGCPNQGGRGSVPPSLSPPSGVCTAFLKRELQSNNNILGGSLRAPH